MFQLNGRQVGIRYVSNAFGKQLGDSKMITGDISDLAFMNGVACYSRHMLSHLQFGLSNLRVMDLALVAQLFLSLTVVRTNLLLERLFEPSVKYKFSVVVYG